MAEISVEELCEHAEWIRRLATALVGPADAGDLAQETMEVALRKPPKRSGPLRPWLAGVARNLARMRRRGAGRRRDREQRSAVEDEVPTPGELVERAETQQRVARGVLELDEPYRSTVLLRYYEGYSSAEIARRQEIPAATVRSRLKTGLDRLRAELDRDVDGGRERWMALLAPLAHADVTPLLKGALLVKTSTKIAAVVIALVAIAAGTRYAGLWGGGDGDDATTATKPTDNGKNGPDTRPTPTRAPALARLGAVNAAISENDPIGTIRLEGQVIDASERPVAGAKVAIDSHPARVVETEGDGSFVIDKLIGRDYQLEATAEGQYAGPVRLRLTDKTEPVVLRVRAADAVAIEVVDAASAKPIAGAAVELRTALVWKATTNAAGVAEIAGVGHEPMVHVTADGYAPASERLVGRRARIRLRGGAPLAGRVVTEAGKPIAGARVVAIPTSEPFPVIDRRRDAIATDAKGRFAFPAVAAGTYQLEAAAPGRATASSTPIVCDGENPRGDIEVVLPEGAAVTGVVKASDGEPVPGADIRVVAVGSVSWRTARRAYSNADGRFEIAGLSRREFDVVAAHQLGASEIARVDLAEKPEASVKLTLSITGSIAGTVVYGAGELLPEARVYVEPEWSGGVEERAEWGVRGSLFRLAGAGGEFTFRGLPKGSYRLRAVHPDAGDLALHANAGEVVEVGATGVKLVVPDSGQLTGKVVYADGESPEVFAISIGWADPVPVVSDDGRFAIDGPGGEYKVELSGPTFAPETITATIDGETDVGTITVERGRSVSGRVLDASGSPVAGAEVAAGALLSGDGSKLFIADESINAKTGATGDDGRFVISGFGKHPITIVAGKDGVGRSRSVQLPRGPDSVTVDLILDATGKLAGIVRKDGKPVGETVVIANPLGATSSNFFVVTGADGSFALDALTAGDYVVYPMIGGGGPRPKDMYIRPVSIGAGETTQVEIEFETGPVELQIAVAADDKTPIPMAGVFLVGLEIDVPNAAALRDGGWLGEFMRENGDSSEPVAMYMRSAMGGAVTVAGLKPRTYSACVIPMPNGFDDARKLESLPMKCLKIPVAASPAKQTVKVVVPGEWAKPKPGE